MFYWTLVHERYDVGPNVSRSQPPALWVWAGNMNWKVAQNRRSVWPIVVRKIHYNEPGHSRQRFDGFNGRPMSGRLKVEYDRKVIMLSKLGPTSWLDKELFCATASWNMDPYSVTASILAPITPQIICIAPL